MSEKLKDGADSLSPAAPRAATRERPRRVVAVTGAASFLGRNLVGLLEEDPTVSRIVALDVARPRTAGPKTRCYDVDFTEPTAEARVAEVLSAERVDSLAHLSFLASPTPATAWAHELESVGTMHVMVAARHAKVRKVVTTTTTLVYGAHPSNPNFLSEAHAPRRESLDPFFADKLEAEELTLRFAERRSGPIATVLRLAPILGPTVQSYVSRYLSRKLVPTMMGFDPLLQFLHEVDAIAAIKLALDRDAKGVFNIAGDGVLPMSTVVKLSGRIAVPLPHPIAETMTAGAWLLQMCEAPPGFLKYLRFLCVADTARARKELGFVPNYTTRETILDFASAQRLRDLKLLQESGS